MIPTRRRLTPPPPRTEDQLRAEYGDVLDTAGLARKYVVIAAGGGRVVVRRRADGVIGTLNYQDGPRLYFGFAPEAVTSESGEDQRPW